MSLKFPWLDLHLLILLLSPLRISGLSALLGLAGSSRWLDSWNALVGLWKGCFRPLVGLNRLFFNDSVDIALFIK